MKDHSLIFLFVLQRWFMTGLTFLIVEPTIPCMPQGLNDPDYPEQWFLKNGPPDYGINVIPAWRKCYNGTGINIAVVDTGIDTENEDLEHKVIWKYPPIEIQHQHGTEVAGLIAAKANNDAFGTGVAFGSMLIDLAYVKSGQNIQIAEVALSVERWAKDIDIFSCSFSRGVDGMSVYKITDGLRSNMQNGAKLGRHGKGSLYVVSSGNGGRFFVPESCAYDEFMNNIHTILVAGTDHTLGTIPSGEKCGAIMITAPTRSLGFYNYPKMTTTFGNSSTDNFGLTSAAVAITSGAIAVALSARPNLTNRDVMHILARTARNNASIPFKVTDTPFECNGAGFEVSSQYGFGLLDVEAMVEVAIDWENVGPRLECIVEFPWGGLPLYGPLVRLTDFFVDSTCLIKYLEQVEVTIEIFDEEAGSVSAELKSPLSFSSTILPGRTFHGIKTLNITVGSVQFWGNDPHGYWTITLYNKYKELNGTIADIRLTFHGIEKRPKQMRKSCDQNLRSTRDSSTNNIKTGMEWSSSELSQKLNLTGIIGIVIGSTLVLGAVAVLIFVVLKRKFKKTGTEITHNEDTCSR